MKKDKQKVKRKRKVFYLLRHNQNKTSQMLLARKTKKRVYLKAIDLQQKLRKYNKRKIPLNNI